jgi:predicted permease
VTRRPAERLYALLLWLHPPAFRRAWGDEILLHVRTAALDRQAPQPLLQTAADGLRSAAREWREVLLPSSAERRASTSQGEPMHNLLRDLVLAARVLVKAPTFTLAAVLTLALGIGANTAVFTLADATLLRPLPVHEPERLVTWSWSSSWPHYQEYARRTDIFEGVMASGGISRLNLTSGDTTQLVQGAYYSGNTFEVLGVRAALGRTLLPSDDKANGPIVAVLGHHFWRTRFGGDPDIVGRTFRINGQSATVVGVAEEGFRGVSLAANPDLYLSAAVSGQFATGFFSRMDRMTTTGFVWLSVTGRLRPGVTAAQASDAMDALYAQLQPPKPGTRREERLELIPLQTRALGSGASSVRSFMTLLTGVVGLTLLIACANLANLLLAKAAGRRREVGVRLALGATRARIVQQMLSESVLLAVLGGALGLLVAKLALGAVQTFELPGGLPLSALPLEISRSTLAVTFVISLVTGVIFGAAPAWRASRSDALASIRGHSRSATSRSHARSVLLAAQVAMSLMLLTGTGLFARSLVAALGSPLGFDPDGVTTATVNLGLARYDTARARGFYEASLESVRQVPGVTHIAWTNLLPTRGAMMWNTESEDGRAITVHSAHVGPEFFGAVGTRLTAGRTFLPTDRSGPDRVAIVNEVMARDFFVGGNPIGKRLKVLDNWVTVVGVAENTIVDELREKPSAQLYLAFDQWLDGPRGIATDTAHLLVRTSGDAASLVPLVRERLRAQEPELPLYSVAPFADATAALVLPQRMGATLFTLFSAVALALVTVGIYGVASYVATLRQREIGVRVALGATGSAIRRMVLGQGAVPIGCGVAAGLLGALYASRATAAFLLDVSPWDPVTFAAMTLLLLSVAAAASYLPARRAARVDPIKALRED